MGRNGNLLLFVFVFSITIASLPFCFSVFFPKPGPGRGRKKPMEHPTTESKMRSNIVRYSIFKQSKSKIGILYYMVLNWKYWKTGL